MAFDAATIIDFDFLISLFIIFISFDCAITPGCHAGFCHATPLSRHYFVDAVCPMFFD
jgi:hypothetical protein